MTLSEQIHIKGRFQRAIRIDYDYCRPDAIDGFHCPSSSAEILLAMADHISRSGQCAFTWTGPYGSGKSSLVVFLCALLSDNKQLQQRALESLDFKVADAIKKQFGGINWNVIPVIGRQEKPADVIGEAIESTILDGLNSYSTWTDSNIVSTITGMVDQTSQHKNGIILFFDEMGKFLESAVQNGTDLFIFQQLAEAACRSEGRLIVVGILHQSFGEYAHKLSQSARDEWTKIQGRFVDLTLRVTVDEQIHLLSRAIESGREVKKISACSNLIAASISRNCPSISRELAENLEKCWPLHPSVACLLGPISKSRFGQNQRSVFGFLNSAEPQGFQQFLRISNHHSLYEPHRLWDYLRINFESLVYASPEGHRWAMCVEVIDRCEALGGNACQIKLIKTIAILDLFRERSGLVATFDVLNVCMTGYAKKSVRSALTRLRELSLVVYRKFIGGYSIYAGSDFDIEKAIANSQVEITESDFVALKTMMGFQPILAKRHYNQTGTLRWFDLMLVPLNNVVEYVASYIPTNNSIGLFLVAVPTHSESTNLGEKLCRIAGRQSLEFNVVIGLSQHSWEVANLYQELLALQKISNEQAELAGDPVARREVETRLSILQTNLETELHRAIDNATWFLKHHKPKRLSQSELSILASTLADREFSKTPKLFNELLNRTKPSSNAIGAQNALLRRMVSNCGEERLGIEGYPAESGLFISLLEQTNLYSKLNGNWGFQLPLNNKNNEKSEIRPLWQAARSYITKHHTHPVSLSKIYEIWRKPPFGVKFGVMPILIVAFILSQHNKIAFYRDGVFQVQVKDIDVEYLTKHPEDVGIRWINPTQTSIEMLTSMAEIVKEFNDKSVINDQSPVNIARGFVAVFENLPQWTIRTTTLSSNATQIRTLLKQASDPNRFLFDDLPNSFVNDFGVKNGINSKRYFELIRSGLMELVQAYPQMLCKLRENILRELQVSGTRQNSIQRLRERADNVRHLSGDFRLEAFIGRLAQYRDTDVDVEGLASLATNKLPHLWADSDFDRANLELAILAQQFVRVEAFARVKGRSAKRQAIAIVVGIDQQQTSLIEEFEVMDDDQAEISELVNNLCDVLNCTTPVDRSVVLAALARVSAQYIEVKS